MRNARIIAAGAAAALAAMAEPLRGAIINVADDVDPASFGLNLRSSFAGPVKPYKGYRAPGKYTPHNGEREMARRRQQALNIYYKAALAATPLLADR